MPGWIDEAINSPDNEEIDSEASAAVLLNNAECQIFEDGKARTKCRVIFKILKSSDVGFGILKEMIHPAREIKGLKGWLIKPDSKTFNLKKSNVVEVDIGLSAGYYYDHKMLMAVFENIEVNDVIAYEYNIVENEYWCSYFQSFIFQYDYPTLSTYFSVVPPKGWKLNFSGRNLEPVIHSVIDEKYIWSSGYLSLFKEEPLMPLDAKNIRILDVGCYDPQSGNMNLFKDWKEVARWESDVFRPAFFATEEISNIAQEVSKNLTDPIKKIIEIAKFVRDEIRYVAVEIGEGRFKPRMASETLTNKYGDCKDKTVLMLSLLKSIGFKASSVLVSTNDSVDIDFPSPYQFNHVIVAINIENIEIGDKYLSAIAGDWIYFDPTDASSEFGELPYLLYGRKVLRLDSAEYEFVNLPLISPDKYYRINRADAILMSNNSIEAEVSITDYYVWANQKSYLIKNMPLDKQIDEHIQQLPQFLKNPQISDYSFNRFEDSCVTKFHLNGENYTSSSGDLIILPANLIKSDNHIIKFEKDRNFPISFGQPSLYEYIINWRFEDNNMYVDGLPDTIGSDCGIAKVNCSYMNQENSLQYYYKSEYAGGKIQPEKVDEVKEFLKCRSRSINSSVVLKRM
ncbi:MAG: DUF3857 domain-containing protein [Candidatus Zixiibacteriota bacterium]